MDADRGPTPRSDPAGFPSSPSPSERRPAPSRPAHRGGEDGLAPPPAGRPRLGLALIPIEMQKRLVNEAIGAATLGPRPLRAPLGALAAPG